MSPLQEVLIRANEFALLSNRCLNSKTEPNALQKASVYATLAIYWQERARLISEGHTVPVAEE